MTKHPHLLHPLVNTAVLHLSLLQRRPEDPLGRRRSIRFRSVERDSEARTLQTALYQILLLRKAMPRHLTHSLRMRTIMPRQHRDLDGASVDAGSPNKKFSLLRHRPRAAYSPGRITTVRQPSLCHPRLSHLQRHTDDLGLPPRAVFPLAQQPLLSAATVRADAREGLLWTRQALRRELPTRSRLPLQVYHHIIITHSLTSMIRQRLKAYRSCHSRLQSFPPDELLHQRQLRLSFTLRITHCSPTGMMSHNRSNRTTRSSCLLQSSCPLSRRMATKLWNAMARSTSLCHQTRTNRGVSQQVTIHENLRQPAKDHQCTSARPQSTSTLSAKSPILFTILH